ncbi:MAG: hypothetical protein KF757_09560 [Phycisphaeraceae bacterium]|nr:hypothetical protein [Phycisphaeraceae bacterium]MCW5763455.1 hypothetical protein [Phycisphaeraceae bacterium]
MASSNSRLVVGMMMACAGVAGSVHAQDSIATGGSLPGDSLDPWNTGLQRTSYVVDMAPFTTSWGNTFAIAPIVKSSKTSPAFSGSLMSAQFLSADLLRGVPFASGSYALWENAPGAGVNPNGTNLVPGSVSPTGFAHQFGALVAEYSTTTGGFNYGGILGAVVNYKHSDPGRLYVTRVVGAVNTANATTGDSARMGIGSVDAHGNAYFRADSFQTAGSPGLPSVSGNNLFRTALLQRGAVLNHINGNTALHNATTNLVINAVPNYGAPAHIPQSIAGVPVVSTPTFVGQYARGSTAPLTVDTSHYAAGVVDHRGAFGMTTDFALGVCGTTFGVLAKDPANITTGMNIFTTDNSGSVLAAQAYFAPTTVTDNSDSFTLTYTNPSREFGHYRSQTGFLGGTGQVAVARDRNGMGLTAATMHENALMNDFSAQILVCRFNPATGASAWTMAAYIDQAFVSGRSGKEVFDGNNNVIGVLTPLFNVTGGSPLGPSLSSPAFDAAGNVWFIGAVELFNRLPGGGSDFDSALFRAVYDEVTFSYKLELVLELGSVFAGQNSGRNYQIRFLNMADHDSVDSGTIFSGNGSSHTWGNLPLSSMSNADPRTNGGMVLQASIVYDVDDDGTFDLAGGADQQYNALLFIGNPTSAGTVPCNIADFSSPYGVLDFFDVQAFLQAFSAQNPTADINKDCLFNFFDVQAYLQAFSAGCP